MELSAVDKRYRLAKKQLLDVQDEIDERQNRLKAIQESITLLEEVGEDVTLDLTFDNPYNVTIGSYWEPMDPRQDRIFEIVDLVGDYAICRTIIRDGQVVDTKSTTNARLDRFDDSNKSKGYRQVGPALVRALQNGKVRRRMTV